MIIIVIYIMLYSTSLNHIIDEYNNGVLSMEYLDQNLTLNNETHFGYYLYETVLQNGIIQAIDLIGDKYEYSSLSETNSMILMGLSKFNYALGNFEISKAQLNKALEHSQSDFEKSIIYQDFFYSFCDSSNCLQYLNDALKLNPGNKILRFDLETYLYNNDIDKSLSYIDSMIAENDLDALLYKAGLIMNENPYESKKLTLKAFEIEENGDAYLLMYDLLANQDISMLERASSLSPKNGEIKIEMGRYYWEISDYNKAIDILEPLVTNFGLLYEVAIHDLAYNYRECENFKKCLNLLSKLDHREELEVDLLTLRYICYSKLNEIDNANSCLQKLKLASSDSEFISLQEYFEEHWGISQ